VTFLSCADKIEISVGRENTSPGRDDPLQAEQAQTFRHVVSHRPSKAMLPALKAVDNRHSQRVYIGNDIWETRHPDGSADWDIAFSPAEMARLEADAARAGIAVEQLIKNRMLGRTAEPVTCAGGIKHLAFR
jgi:hypothetical protein